MAPYNFPAKARPPLALSGPPPGLNLSFQPPHRAGWSPHSSQTHLEHSRVHAFPPTWMSFLPFLSSSVPGTVPSAAGC